MPALTPVQSEALRLIVSATVEAVKAAGPHGAPAGVIYAALMHQGCTKNQFDSLMGALVRKGKLTHDPESHLYFLATDVHYSPAFLLNALCNPALQPSQWTQHADEVTCPECQRVLNTRNMRDQSNG